MKDMDTADVISPYLKLPLRTIEAVRPVLARNRKQGGRVHPSSTGITADRKSAGDVPE
jgi:hypothetical protein